jgi:hypothetical protein
MSIKFGNEINAFSTKIGLVAKHATGPILFAIAAISSAPYLLVNDKQLSKHH